MMKQHRFSPGAFRRRYLPWLFLLLLPSFIVDFVFLYRIITLHPVALTAVGDFDLRTIVEVFLGNALFLKTWAIGWYFIQRFIYRNSFIYQKKGAWVYRRRLLNASDGYFDPSVYLEIRLENIRTVERRRQDIRVYGEMESNWLNGDEKVVKTRPVHKVVIPACFEDMDGLYKVIQEAVSKVI